MRPGLILVFAVGILGAAASPLPRGDDRFWLGMTRAQVDSAVSVRGLSVISSGASFLACMSDDPAVDYEQYAFFPAPHGMFLLWRVTIGYRIGASPAEFTAVRGELMRQLGERVSDSWDADAEASPAESRPTATAQRVIWADPFTTVQLGARWSGAPDRSADRMMITWTDRRLQRLVDAGRKRKTSRSK